MTARSIRIWAVVHKWTSLVSTLFLLMLCITGLPMIFRHEIDHAIGQSPRVPEHAASAPRATLDQVGASALKDHPGHVLLYLSWDKDEPGIVYTFTNTSVTANPNTTSVKAYDAVTAQSLGGVGGGIMLFITRLHVDMFLGLPGKLFLGFMGLLMAVAIVSGVVLYWPFTRRLAFGTLRDGKAKRVAWLDWHNLLGIVTIVWALVVGLTGTINTLAEPMLKMWQVNELAAMSAPFKGQPPPSRLASIDAVVAHARAAAPGMHPGFIAFPGTPFTSPHHFAAFMRGDSVLTSRLYKPILLDGETAVADVTTEFPLYLKALLISQPLHFGDYAGMPLKIIWAVLDVMTIVVLGSGLYLWWAKRRKLKRGAELLQGARMPQAAE